MNQNNEAPDKVLEFNVPTKGTWNSIASNMLSPDSLFNSLNVFIREGKLRTRAGLRLLNDSSLDFPVIGGAMAVTPTEKVLLAITKNNLWTLRKGEVAWVADSTTSFAVDDNSIIDICFLETAGEYVAIIANNETPLKRWLDGTPAGVIVPDAGTVPIAKSVCTAGRRIVALVEPHTLRWTSITNDLGVTNPTFDNWNDLNYVKKAETNDLGICVRSISTLSFALYKERSIYLAKAKAGTNADAWTFNEPIVVEGPAGVHSVVDLDGMHMYMTPSGRIGLFDGTSYPKWIADGLWLRLQKEIDPEWSYKIFGVLDYRLHTVTFYYPKLGDNGFLKHFVTVNIPLEGSGVTNFAHFLGESELGLSFGYEMRFQQEVNRSLLFSSNLPVTKSFVSDEDFEMDNSSIFNCLIQTPMLALPNLKSHQLVSQLFVERGYGFGSLNVYSVTSDFLNNKEGNIDEGNPQLVSLEFSDQVYEYIAFNQPARFFGLRLNWTSTDNVRYAGIQVNGRLS